MNEQKKDMALDEEALESVTGGGREHYLDFSKEKMQELLDQAFAQTQGTDSTNDSKEKQP